jgi:hypothetical protein
VTPKPRRTLARTLQSTPRPPRVTDLTATPAKTHPNQAIEREYFANAQLATVTPKTKEPKGKSKKHKPDDGVE